MTNCPQCNTEMTIDSTDQFWYCETCDNEFQLIDGEWIVVS